MYTGLYAAVSGSLTQEKRLDILTNNLANATTAGFKADKAVFHVAPLPEVIGPVQAPGAPRPVVTSVNRLRGYDSPQSHIATVHTDFTQGPLRPSGNPLDLALQGPGFFVVQGPDEQPAYTRQGTFALNSDRVLVTADGLPVLGERGPIRIQGAHVEIDASGGIKVDGQVVDRLQLVTFPDQAVLEKTAGTLFHATTPDAAQPAEAVTVHQGTIEASNSDPLRTMVAVLETSRAYEAYQKVIQAFDDTAGRAVNDIARVG